MNPALTGAHSGSYRIMTGYRNQWSRSLEAPFTMMSVAGDLRFNLSNKGSFSAGNDQVAVGLLFLSERIGVYDNNTNQIGLSAAYHKLLSKATNQYLSAGLQLGLGIKGVNYEDLTFADEFNGVNGYTNPTEEVLPNNNVAYGDLGLGLHYSISPTKKSNYYLGFSLLHFNQPNISYFDSDNRFPDEYAGFKYPAKWSFHGGGSMPIGEVTKIEPRIVFFSQGEFSSATIGSALRYEFINSDGEAVHIGGWLRTSKSLTTYQPTDAILTAAYEKNGLLIGFSYDANLRGLSNFPGANVFELSISFIGDHDNSAAICPKF
jgi:type IX secretion system PorP/SprF family membrane protein